MHLWPISLLPMLAHFWPRNTESEIARSWRQAQSRELFTHPTAGTADSTAERNKGLWRHLDFKEDCSWNGLPFGGRGTPLRGLAANQFLCVLKKVAGALQGFSTPPSNALSWIRRLHEAKHKQKSPLNRLHSLTFKQASIREQPKRERGRGRAKHHSLLKVIVAVSLSGFFCAFVLSVYCLLNQLALS